MGKYRENHLNPGVKPFPSEVLPQLPRCLVQSSDRLYCPTLVTM